MQRLLATGCAALLLLGVSLGAGSCKPRENAPGPKPSDGGGGRDTGVPTVVVRGPEAPEGGRPMPEKLRERVYRLPMLFQTNRGQAPKAARFVAHHRSHTLLVMDDAIEVWGAAPSSDPQGPDARDPRAGPRAGPRADTREVPGDGPPPRAAAASPLRLGFGAREGAGAPIADVPLKARANHYPAGPASDAILDIPLSEGVRYPKIYPDVDLIIRGTRGHANISFLVGPAGDTQHVRLRVPKEFRATIDPDGALRVRALGTGADGAEWVLSPPVAYACDAAFTPLRDLRARYVSIGGRIGAGEFGIRVGGRLAGEHVLIDPDLGYGTWLGSEGTDFVDTNGLALGASGRVYVAEKQFDLPGDSDFGRTLIRAIDFTDQNDPQILYETSFDALGSTALAAGPGAEVLFTGATREDFPIVGQTYQTSRGGALNTNGVIGALDASGTLARSTYLASWGDNTGGGAQYAPNSIALDTSAGAPRVWVVGAAWGFGFDPASEFTHGPSTLSPLPYGGHGVTNDDDGFAVVLPLDLSTVDAFTFLGGAGFDGAGDLAVIGGRVLIGGFTGSTNFPVTPGAAQTSLSAGSGFIGGSQPGAASRDTFIAELDQSAVLLRATYHGGSAFDDLGSIAVDPLGRPCVVMRTGSNADTGISALVSRLAPDLSSVVSQTIIGGDEVDEGTGIDVDGSGRIHAVGWTRSEGLDTATAIDDTVQGDEGWMTQLTPAGGIAYLTYVGGSHTDRVESIALREPGEIFVLGHTGSTDFPGPSTLSAARQNSLDGFLVLYTQDLPPEPDFLTMFDSPHAINLDDFTTMTILVGNATATPLAGATLEVTLPAGLTHMLSVPGASVVGNTLTWTVGPLGPGSGRAFSATLRGVAPGTHTTSARLLVAGAPLDNEDEETLVLPDPAPILTLTKTGPALVPRGGAGVYRVRVRNFGTTDAVTLEIADTLDAPKVATITAATEIAVPAGAPASTITFTDSQAAWSIGLLAPGQERQMLVFVQFTADTADLVTNTAQLTSSAYPNLVLTSLVQTQLQPVSADLRVTLQPMEVLSGGPNPYKRFPMLVEETTGTAEDMGIINLVLTFDLPDGPPTNSGIDLSAAGAFPGIVRHVVGTPTSYKGAINLPRVLGPLPLAQEIYLPRTVTLVFHEDVTVTNLRVEVSSDLVEETNAANNVDTGP